MASLNMFKGTNGNWEIDGEINVEKKCLTISVREDGNTILAYDVTEPEAEHAFRALLSLFAPSASALGSDFEDWFRAALKKLTPPRPTEIKKRFSDILGRLGGRRVAQSDRKQKYVQRDSRLAAGKSKPPVTQVAANDVADSKRDATAKKNAKPKGGKKGSVVA